MTYSYELSADDGFLMMIYISLNDFARHILELLLAAAYDISLIISHLYLFR